METNSDFDPGDIFNNIMIVLNYIEIGKIAQKKSK
jgi:hypothetical protein